MNAKKILVIESDINLAVEIKDHLHINGYEAHISEDSIHAIELTKILHPDLILINSSMKKKNGTVSDIFLHTDPLISTFPMIFLTEKGAISRDEHGLENGAFDCIEKPVNNKVLAIRIKSFFLKYAKVIKKYEDNMEKLRGDITFALPHEFRTSLSGIIGCSSIIQQITKSFNPGSMEKIKEVNEMSSAILEAGKQLYRLTENFLFYSQIATMQGKQDKINELRRYSIYNSKEIIAEVVSGLTSDTPRAGNVIMQLENANLNISFFNFQKLIYELVDNALKFSVEGSKIYVEAYIDAQDYVFMVSDEGRGMTPYQIDSIGAYRQFDRYVYEQQGAGLGLIIAKLLVALHDGDFVIKSEIGNGTAITIKLPIGENI